MKLNAEQIIKAFEVCRGNDLCNECPYEENVDCLRLREKHAIALMKSQEQKIKELTEENERLEAQVKMWTSTAYCEKDRAESIKADTVRRMQERLKATPIWFKQEYVKYFDQPSTIKVCPFIDKEDIDQIAKEMLDGKDTKVLTKSEGI